MYMLRLFYVLYSCKKKFNKENYDSCFFEMSYYYTILRVTG